MHRTSPLSPLILVFIFPISLVAVFVAALFFVDVLEPSRFNGFGGRSVVEALIVFGGCIGLGSLWVCYFHFRRFESPPRFARWHLVALGMGCTVSVYLVAIALKASVVSFAILLGSPLVPAILFSAWIVRTRVAV